MHPIRFKLLKQFIDGISEDINIEYMKSQFQSSEEDINVDYNPYNNMKVSKYNPVYSIFFNMDLSNYNKIGFNNMYISRTITLHNSSSRTLERSWRRCISPTLPQVLRVLCSRSWSPFAFHCSKTLEKPYTCRLCCLGRLDAVEIV